MPTAAIIGGGVIGSAWASRFLLNGWQVHFRDPAPNSEAVLNKVLDKARRWVPEVYDQLPQEGALILCASIEDAVSAADWVQESTPERLEIKQAVLAEIQESCAAEAIVASSTSGFMPSELQAGSARPEQILVAHPYNPAYLLPIVVVPSAVVPEDTVQRAEALLSDIGMKPITLRAEIPLTLEIGCLRPCGARRCGSSKTASPPPSRSMTS